MKGTMMSLVLALGVTASAFAGADPKDLPLLKKINGMYHNYDGKVGFWCVAQPDLSDDFNKALLETYGENDFVPAMKKARYAVAFDTERGPLITAYPPVTGKARVDGPVKELMEGHFQTLLTYALGFLHSNMSAELYAQRYLARCKVKVTRVKTGYRIVQVFPDQTIDCHFDHSLWMTSVKFITKAGPSPDYKLKFRDTPKGLVLGEIEEEGENGTLHCVIGYTGVGGYNLPDRIWIEGQDSLGLGVPIGVTFQLFGHKLDSLMGEVNDPYGTVLDRGN